MQVWLLVTGYGCKHKPSVHRAVFAEKVRRSCINVGNPLIVLITRRSFTNHRCKNVFYRFLAFIFFNFDNVYYFVSSFFV